MILKNVELSFAFLARTDDSDKYRVTFKPDEATQKALEKAMSDVAQKNACEEPDWWGSYKEEAGTYSAKASATIRTKKGEEIENKVRVYDKSAKLMEEIPNVQNGAIANIEVEPYFTEYKKKKGVMLGLRSVQLLKYEEYTGGNPYKDESEENPYYGD